MFIFPGSDSNVVVLDKRSHPFRAVLVEGFFVQKSAFLFRAIFCISIFPFFPSIGMRSLPNILPSVKLPNFMNVSCFCCITCFSWKKKGKFGKKRTS